MSKEPRYENLLYPFGFLMGRAGQHLPKHFLKEQFPLPLYVNPNTKYVVARKLDRVCFLTGEIVYPQAPMKTLAEIANVVLEAGDQCQNIIDQLIGRFAIVIASEDGIWAQNDASGMRSLYFDIETGDPVIASHAGLIATINGTLAASPVSPFRKLGCPGIGTPYLNVYRVPPNVRFNLATGILERFFPAADLTKYSLEDAWTFALDRASIAGVEFTRRHRIVTSLTAGRDSRVTLLALEKVRGDIGFFTYTRRVESHDIDCGVASVIAKQLGLDHTVIDYAELDRDERLLELIKRNAYGHHQHGLAMVYAQLPLFSRCLHVRSNMLEITRSNLYNTAKKGKRFQDGLVNAGSLAEYYARAGHMELTHQQFDAFEYYMEACDLHQAWSYMSSWDLFFIEHRMGAWRAGIIEESDVGFDTVNLFNSREILKRFYGTDQDERANSNLVYERIRERMPEIEHVPTNPKSLEF